MSDRSALPNALRALTAFSATLSITALDMQSNVAVIQYGKAALVVDYSLCLSEEAIDDRQSRARISQHHGKATHEQSCTPSYSAQYRTALPELKSKMMVVGELAQSDNTGMHSLSYVLQGITLQAMLLKECLDLDMDVWERAARVESQSRWDEATKRASIKAS